MKKIVAVLIVLGLCANMGFAESVKLGESDAGFYYTVGVIAAFLYMDQTSQADRQIEEARLYSVNASNNDFNFGVYWQMYFRSWRDKDRLNALEYGDQAIKDRASSDNHYKQYAERSLLAGVFLTISLLSFYVGITKSIKARKEKTGLKKVGLYFENGELKGKFVQKF
jgi:hypothetical protein